MTSLSINVRFLLWSRKIARKEWEAWLVNRTKFPRDTCKRLIRGTLQDVEISGPQLRALADALGVNKDDLQSANLPNDRAHVLSENLRFLFSNLGHGGKKSVAVKLDIDPTTVSRWLSGAYEPQPASLRQIASEFGLPSGTNLHKDPIFLSAEPIAVNERRHWLTQRINALPTNELKELFPALHRLLEER